MNPSPRSRIDRSVRSPSPIHVGLGLLLVLAHAVVAPPTTRATSELRFADTAFERLWARSDAAIAAIAAIATDHTWLWGPDPLLAAREPYAEGVGGQRLVQYFYGSCWFRGEGG